MANNKLLLLEDVDGLGRKGEIVGVRPGYARNFLLPQILAVIADKQAIRMQARLQEERRQRAVVDKKESDELAAQLQNVVVNAIVKIDHEGHMYGSVSAVDIVHLLEQQSNIKLEKRNILLPHAIKNVGDHSIKVRLKEGVTGSFSLKITPEEQPKEAVEEKKEEEKPARRKRKRSPEEAEASE